MKNTTNIKKKLLKILSLNKKTYEGLNIDRLVIFGMFFLEKQGIPLYFDYIAVCLFKLFPKKFSMSNFEKYPDTFRINNSVRRLAGSLKSEGNITWASGNVENGFSLTETGREIALQVETFLKNPKGKKITSKPKFKRSRGRFVDDDIKEIEVSVLYKKWLQKENKISDYEIISFLNAMPYTPKELLLKYLSQLRQSANTVKNKEVLNFLNWMEKKFYHIFY